MLQPSQAWKHTQAERIHTFVPFAKVQSWSRRSPNVAWSRFPLAVHRWSSSFRCFLRLCLQQTLWTGMSTWTLWASCGTRRAATNAKRATTWPCPTSNTSTWLSIVSTRGLQRFLCPSSLNYSKHVSSQKMTHSDMKVCRSRDGRWVQNLAWQAVEVGSFLSALPSSHVNSGRQRKISALIAAALQRTRRHSRGGISFEK